MTTLAIALLLVLVKTTHQMPHAVPHVAKEVGSEAAPNQYPWLLTIQGESGYNGHGCAASLISADVIISASHCFPCNRTHTRVSAAQMKGYSIVAGKHSFLKTEPGEQRRTLEYGICPTFDEDDTSRHDIILIKLSSPLTLSKTVKPIQWADLNDDFVGKTCHVAGWGSIGKDENSPQKVQHAQVLIEESKECGSDQRTICAGTTKEWRKSNKSENRAVVGGGDSGGPLTCKNEKGVPTLAGIVSAGSLCGNNDNALHPDEYTKVSAFDCWIKATMNELKNL